MADKKQFEAALRGALARWKEPEWLRDVTEEMPPMPAKFDTDIPLVGKKQGKMSKMEDFGMKKGRSWKKSTAAALCAAAIVAGSVCVYAAVPAVRAYINMLFLKEESVMRLTEVPEGYIGITTAEELEAVREELSGNYILMNDIRIPDAWYEDGGIYEDGFLPIGMEIVAPNPDNDYTFRRIKPYTGIFNGNGYVISNVHIEADGDDDYVGLFGQSEMEFYWEINPGEEDGPLESKGGIIKNLGVVDSSITVTEENKSSSNSIGMIVGQGTYVVGCFTDNVKITYNHPQEYAYTGMNPPAYTYAEDVNYVIDGVKIGGVAGEASIIDSCWSGADITVTGATPAENRVFAAGVCGYATTCVTSYFDGTIDSPVVDWEVAYTIQVDPPIMLSGTALWDISIRMIEAENPGKSVDRDTIMEEYRKGTNLYVFISEMYPEYTQWNFVKFLSFYTEVDSVFSQNYMTYEVDTVETERIYFLDPFLKDRERRMLAELIADVFTGEEFVKFCQENGVKYGAYDNYDLRREPDCDFEGFDFDYIWYREEGKNPVLRLFSYTWEEQGIIQKHETTIPPEAVIK